MYLSWNRCPQVLIRHSHRVGRKQKDTSNLALLFGWTKSQTDSRPCQPVCTVEQDAEDLWWTLAYLRFSPAGEIPHELVALTATDGAHVAQHVALGTIWKQQERLRTLWLVERGIMWTRQYRLRAEWSILQGWPFPKCVSLYDQCHAAAQSL